MRRKMCKRKGFTMVELMVVVIIMAILGLVLAGPAFADAVAMCRVKIIVERIAEISVHGNPEIYLNIAEDKESRAEGSYDIAVNYNAQILANIDKKLPDGMSLFVSLQHPNGSFGPEVLLSENPRTVVSGISPVASKDNRINYRLVCEGIDNYKGEAAVSFTITDN